MTTGIAGQITSPTGISAIQARSNALANMAAPVSPTTFTFWAGFDGANNIASNPQYSGDMQSIAVGALIKRGVRQ